MPGCSPVAGSILIGVISEEHLEQCFSKSGTRCLGGPALGHEGCRAAVSTVDLHLKGKKSAAQGQSTPATEKTEAIPEQLNPGRRKLLEHVLSCMSIVVR